MYNELMKTYYHVTLRKKSIPLSATSCAAHVALMFLNFHVDIYKLYYELMEMYYRATLRKKSMTLSATSWRHMS
jgi:hypothetical protein